MVIETLAAAGPDGESGSLGMMLAMGAFLLLTMLPSAAMVIGAAMTIIGVVRRSGSTALVSPSQYPGFPAQYVEDSQPRRARSTTLIVVGSAVLVLGLAAQLFPIAAIELLL